MTILQVTNRIPWPLNDGGNIATYNVTRYLHGAGHRVELACLNTLKHRQDPDAVREATAVHSVDIDTTVTAWGAFKGLFASMPYNVGRFWSPAFVQLLDRLLHARDYDLVQLEGSYMSLYAAAIRAVSQVPIILRSHNVEHQIWQRLAINEKKTLKRWYLKQLGIKIARWERAHLQDYDAIIPIASQDEAFYRAQGCKQPIRTISGGVDLGTCSPRRPLEANLKVGFLGSFEWMPNVQGLHWLLDHVWQQVHSDFPQLELHVAGKNPPDYLGRLSVPGMTFHGMVPDAATFLESCHFFIVPLLSGGGMRLKVAEAMAMGRCVISTPIGAEGIEAQRGQELVLAESPEEWRTAFKELVPAPERSLAIAHRARNFAQRRLGLESVGQQFEAFYREVLG